MPKQLKVIGIVISFALAFSSMALSAEDAYTQNKAIDSALNELEEQMQSTAREDYSIPLEAQIIKETPLKKQEVKKQEEQVYEEEMPMEFEAEYRYAPRQGVSSMDDSGSVGLTTAGSEFVYTYKIFDKIPLEMGLGAEYIGIDNSTNFSLPTRLTETSFGTNITLPFFLDKTYLHLGIVPSFFSENWSFNSIDFKMLGQAIFIYKQNDELIFVAGVASFPGYYTSIAPVIGVMYKPNDKLTFNLMPPDPTICYAITKKLTAFAEYNLISNEYKVNKDNMANVTLRYNEQSAGLGLNYQLNKYTNAVFSAGQIFKRNFQYRDSLGTLKIKSGLYSELKFNINM